MSDIYDFNEVRKLPIPNNRKYSIDSENGYYLTNNDVQQVLRDGNLSIFSAIYNSEFTSISFDEGVPRESAYKFLRDLNRHSTSELSEEEISEGLKNKVVDGIFDVVLDPRNQVNLHVPINMDAQQDAAKKSILGKEEKRRSADNPGSKFVMQIQNMVGKEVIGITAVSMKTYFLLSNYYNTEYRKIIDLLKSKRYDDIVELLDRLIFTDYINKNRKGILANVNLNPIIKYLKDNKIETITLNNGSIFNLKQVLEELRDSADVPDASLSLSGLLSAATDNAKELILAKINATSKYVDIYNYLISIGTSFSEIADIMTSQIFNDVVKLTDGNIFDKSTYRFSLETAINFYLNRDILPYTDIDTLNKVLEKYIPNTGERIPLLKVSNDINVLENISNKLLTDIKNLRSSNKGNEEDYDYYDDYYEEDEGDYDDTYTPKSSRDFITNPLTKTDYINTYKVIRSFIKRARNLSQIPNSDKQLSILTIINDNIIPATKEMETLGGMAGINQGIRTNSFDKYKYIKRINNYINNKVIEYNNTHSDQLSTFDLMTFLSDPYMQQVYINEYEKIKNTYNILRAITTVPHFNEMFKVLYLDNTSIKWLSVKNRLEEKIADRVLTNITQQLNQSEYRELTKYVNDILIYNWIKTLDRDLIIPVGQKYFVNHLGKTNINTLENFSIKLNTVEGLATFKRTMDESIIPALKEHKDFKNNQFIKSLTWGVYDNYVTKKPNIYYKLPINMMQIDNSVKNQTIYEVILSDFNKLNGKTYNGWNIIDLFYLYNLLVNKDAFGQRSMTRLFEDVTKINSSNLLATQFYKYLSDLDYSISEDLDFNIFDLKYRLAPIASNKNKFGIEEKPNSLILKDIFEDIITYEDIDPSTVDVSYFTLNMPLLSKRSSSRVKENIKEIKPSESFYKKPLDTREVITTIVNKFKEVYNAPINLVYNEDIETSTDELVKNSEAFIDNGEVFINLDKADVTAPLHEFTHLVLAGIKTINPEVYYNILSNISTHPMYNIISSNPIYKNKHGSDRDEEVFATLLGEYFKNKLYKWSGNSEFSNSDKITKSVIDKLFQINSGDIDIQSLMNTSLDTLLDVFSSGLVAGTFSDFINIDYIKLNQKLATIKNQLIENETIKENCYE